MSEKDKKEPTTNKVELTAEWYNGINAVKKTIKLEGKENTRELLNLADGWLEGENDD